MVQVGPFFDERKLKVWLYEIAMRLSHAAIILKLLETQAHYLKVNNEWWSKYRGVKI